MNKLKRATKDPGFWVQDFGLVIDDVSEYEDCAYMCYKNLPGISNLGNIGKKEQITKLVCFMKEQYKHVLALSYDFEEKKAGILALESEWMLMQQFLETKVFTENDREPLLKTEDDRERRDERVYARERSRSPERRD